MRLGKLLPWLAIGFGAWYFLKGQGGNKVDPVQPHPDGGATNFSVSWQ